MDIVAAETNKFEQVKSLNIGSKDALRLLAIPPAKDVQYRFDTRSPHIVWINDCEKYFFFLLLLSRPFTSSTIYS